MQSAALSSWINVFWKHLMEFGTFANSFCLRYTDASVDDPNLFVHQINTLRIRLYPVWRLFNSPWKRSRRPFNVGVNALYLNMMKKRFELWHWPVVYESLADDRTHLHLGKPWKLANLNRKWVNWNRKFCWNNTVSLIFAEISEFQKLSGSIKFVCPPVRKLEII